MMSQKRSGHFVFHVAIGLLSCMPLMPAGAACLSQIALSDPATTNYAARTGDARCEGMVVSPVAGDELELVSLTHNSLASALREGMGAKKPLRVSVQSNTDGLVRLRGVGIPIGLYYRLDADLLQAHRYTMNWPLDVVSAAHIASDQIGLIAFMTDPDGVPTYLPVNVALPTAAQPTSASPIVAVLRTDAPIENVEWCFAAPTCDFKDLTATDGEAFVITIKGVVKAGALKLRWTSSANGRRHSAIFAINP